MNRRVPFPRRRRSGLTLTEVVVASLLAALLTAQVLAVTREHGRQVSQARLRVQAVREAERLLAQWYETGSGPPRSAAGRLPDCGLSWRTEVVPRPIDPALQAEVVRLSLRGVDGPPAGPAITEWEVLARRPTPGGGATP